MTLAGKIPLTRLYRKVSSKTGDQYFVGRLGAARVLLFRSREQGNEGDDEIFELLVEAVEGDQPAGRAPRQKRQHRKGNVVDSLRRLGNDLENAEADRQPRTRRQATTEIVDDDIPDFAR